MMTGNKLVYAGLIAILSFSLLAMHTTETNAEEVYNHLLLCGRLNLGILMNLEA